MSDTTLWHVEDMGTPLKRMPRLVTTWADPRCQVRYRLVRLTDQTLVVERAEQDSLGTDRWTPVGSKIEYAKARSDDPALLLAFAVEDLARQLAALSENTP